MRRLEAKGLVVEGQEQAPEQAQRLGGLAHQPEIGGFSVQGGADWVGAALAGRVQDEAEDQPS